MAIKAISQFDAAMPASNDKILFEQNGEGKSATVKDIGKAIGINMDLLWTNANIYGAFSAQTISLDTTGYKFFIEVFYGWEGQLTWVVSKLLQRGSNWVEHVRETSSRRQITINDDSIVFGDCYRYLTYGNTTGTVENSNHVPYKIYGVK